MNDEQNPCAHERRVTYTPHPGLPGKNERCLDCGRTWPVLFPSAFLSHPITFADNLPGAGETWTVVPLRLPGED